MYQSDMGDQGSSSSDGETRLHAMRSGHGGNVVRPSTTRHGGAGKDNNPESAMRASIRQVDIPGELSARPARVGDDDDPELRAALEASLRDSYPQGGSPSWTSRSTGQSGSSARDATRARWTNFNINAVPSSPAHRRIAPHPATPAAPAAANSTLTVTDSEDELTCGICQEVVYQPLRVQECRHIFCGSCLSQWFRSKTRVSRREGAYAWNADIINQGIVDCPLCRVTVRSPPRSDPTLNTRLDRYLQRHPDKKRTVDEMREAATHYEPGEDIVPTRQQPTGHGHHQHRNVQSTGGSYYTTAQVPVDPYTLMNQTASRNHRVGHGVTTQYQTRGYQQPRYQQYDYPQYQGRVSTAASGPRTHVHRPDSRRDAGRYRTSSDSSSSAASVTHAYGGHRSVRRRSGSSGGFFSRRSRR
jgi:hypothetical protein